MPIDLLYLIFVCIGVWKGYRNGLIVSIFSLLSLAIGLAAALRFSAYMANLLHGWVDNYVDWLPFFGFVLVFALTVAVVRIVARLLKDVVAFLLLGWLDKLGGMLLYWLLYTLIFSTLLFFILHLHIVNQPSKHHSWVYVNLYPISRTTLHLIGVVLPYGRNAFQQLDYFFARTSH